VSSDSTKWIDWHPKVGDVRPEVYRVRQGDSGNWTNGIAHGVVVNRWDVTEYRYQIPATKETGGGGSMNGVPVETVVELLMENAAHAKAGGGQIVLGGELYDSLRESDLREYIREYVETLVRTGENECPENERQ
jgi:translation initiation factor 2 beta subunit (eIF-2beta)/eIF-5